MKNTTLRKVADIEVSPAVRAWLFSGIVLVFFQIVIGGITRLTGSGLSITDWKPIMGFIPPLNAEAWEHAFSLYKATPQYLKINEGMEMAEFKFIYFWEWFHRLWARTLFLVFTVGFFWFLAKGKMPAALRRPLLIIVLMGAFEGFLGWIMVFSGLKERPWVNAYNLTLHLSMGMLIFSYLVWTYLRTVPMIYAQLDKIVSKWVFRWITALAFIQIMLGGMMSGMKAGLAYPTWPSQGGVFLPEVLMDSSAWNMTNVDVYDGHAFMPALIQFLHRNVAYLLTISILYLFFRLYKNVAQISFRQSLWVVLGLLVIQILLGIFTLINCIGGIPVTLGVLHQSFGVLLFGALLNLHFRHSKGTY